MVENHEFSMNGIEKHHTNLHIIKVSIVGADVRVNTKTLYRIEYKFIGTHIAKE